MTQTPPPPAPPAQPPASAPAAPNPGSGHPPGFNEADAAARARLEEAFPTPLPPGAPADAAAAATAPPAGEPAPFDIWADDADTSMIPDEMPYRDAVKLRSEIAAARDQLRPFRDAFGSLETSEREAFLAAAPTAGSDLAVFAQLAPTLHPDDRAYMLDAFQLMSTDPAAAAEMLAQGAEVLRSQFTQPGAQPPPAAPPNLTDPNAWVDPAAAAPLPPEQQPMTRGDFLNMMAERDYAGQVKANEATILAKARELGYDPDSTDPLVRNRFQSFIGMAAQPDVGGDLDRAHTLMQQQDQAVIDGFVQAKAADADRPGAPAIGATPADTRVLDTMSDAREAAQGRIDAALGPDPRRRGAD